MSRSRRIAVLAGVVIAAGVIAVVAILLSHSSGKSPAKALTTAGTTTETTTTGTTTAPAQINSAAAITALFVGIPQHRDTLGKPSAPVSVVVFEDPQCPFCAEWNLNTLSTVLTQFVRTGKVKLVYRGIQIIGPNSGTGLRAIVAAGRQNKLWDLNEGLYANQGKENSGWITSNLVLGLAADLGINGTKLVADANSKAVTSELEAAATEASKDGVQGTPSFEILHPPGLPTQLHESSLDPAGFVAALTAAIG